MKNILLLLLLLFPVLVTAQIEMSPPGNAEADTSRGVALVIVALPVQHGDSLTTTLYDVQPMEVYRTLKVAKNMKLNDPNMNAYLTSYWSLDWKKIEYDDVLIFKKRKQK